MVLRNVVQPESGWPSTISSSCIASPHRATPQYANARLDAAGEMVQQRSLLFVPEIAPDSTCHRGARYAPPDQIDGSTLDTVGTALLDELRPVSGETSHCGAYTVAMTERSCQAIPHCLYSSWLAARKWRICLACVPMLNSLWCGPARG